MHRRIAVRVEAADPVSQAGIATQLRGRPEVLVVDAAGQAEVALVVCDEVDDDAAGRVRRLVQEGCARVVLVVTRLDDGSLVQGVQAGACGFVRRTEAVPERLAAAVEAAAKGDGTLPPDLLGRLLSQMNRLQTQVLAPRGFTLAGLTEREVAVLRLVADGFDTHEIAAQLCYSERTVKSVIHDVTTRFRLRNRSHAVAFAVRQGLI